MRASSLPHPTCSTFKNLAPNAHEVTGNETRALTRLANELPASFDHLVEMPLTISRRIIVSDMDKSGHDAAEMATTFASTGSPAQTVQPRKASHGDLGLITSNEVEILISNSNKTKKLADTTTHYARFSVLLAAM